MLLLSKGVSLQGHVHYDTELIILADSESSLVTWQLTKSAVVTVVDAYNQIFALLLGVFSDLYQHKIGYGNKLYILEGFTVPKFSLLAAAGLLQEF